MSSQFNFPRRWLSNSTSSDSMKTLNEKSTSSISKVDSATSDLNRSISKSSSSGSSHIVELKVFLEGSRVPLEV